MANKLAVKKKDRLFLFKRIIGLMAQRAPFTQYQLEIGSYLLKKGCGYEVGQIIKGRKMGEGKFKVKVITGLYFDFHQNKITHTAENRIAKTN